MRILEILLAFLILLSLLIGYNGLPGGDVIILLACGLLGLFYLITGVGLSKNSIRQRLKNAEPGERPLIIMHATAGLLFAFGCFCIYWNEMFLPYRTILIQIGILLFTLLMFFDLLLIEKSDRGLYRFIIVRSALFCVVLLFYLLVSVERRLAWKYDDQYFREILQYAIENPDDKQAQKNVEDYQRRMNGEIVLDDEVIE